MAACIDTNPPAASNLMITDLPPELLENIFSYLHLNLECLLRLATVCVKFRQAALNIPIAVHIPLQDKELRLVSSHKIPILTLCNQEPALFVNYQIFRLNLCRLSSAQLVSNDYLPRSNMSELSPHYIEILNHLSSTSHWSLKHLMINADLHTNQDTISPLNSNRRVAQGIPRCASLLSSFKNLHFLSLHFTPQIELRQRILGTGNMQELVDRLLCDLTQLKTLYIFVCPAQKLSIRSESLEKICIYKSEFVELTRVNCPKLKVLMLHEGLIELFFKAHQDEGGQTGGRKLLCGIFDTLYEGCPKLEFFNTVNLSLLRQHQLNKKEWTYYALRLCVKQYKRRYGPLVNENQQVVLR